MGEGPAHRFAVQFGDQHDAMLLGAAMLQVAPMLDGEIGIAATVGLERRLMVLQSDDEGQDGRLVGGQTGFTNPGRANGRAP
jgi:hypothetical protein